MSFALSCLPFDLLLFLRTCLLLPVSFSIFLWFLQSSSFPFLRSFPLSLDLQPHNEYTFPTRASYRTRRTIFLDDPPLYLFQGKSSVCLPTPVPPSKSLPRPQSSPAERPRGMEWSLSVGAQQPRYSP